VVDAFNFPQDFSSLDELRDRDLASALRQL
jgi:hypothetical protein